MTRRRDQYVQVHDEKTVKMLGKRSAMHPDGLGSSHAREAANRLHRENRVAWWRTGDSRAADRCDQRCPERMINCVENRSSEKQPAR